MPRTIQISEAKEIRPLYALRGYQYVAPYVGFDGANYVFETSFGTFTWKQPLNLLEFAFRDGNKIVDKAFFVLQENSSGTWLSLLEFENIAVQAGNDYYDLRYDVTKKYHGRKRIIAHVILTMMFSKWNPPLISVNVERTPDWFAIGLNHFRWILVVAPSPEWKFYVLTPTQRVDLSQLTTMVSIGTGNITKLSKQSQETLFEQYLQLSWQLPSEIVAGKDVEFNIRGFAVLFQQDIAYIDPVTIVTQSSTTSTRLETQRKVFKNPRGLHYYYALFYYEDTAGKVYEIRLYRSADGITWNASDYQTIATLKSGQWYSASLWIYNDGSQLVVYITYDDVTGNVYYIKGTIADGASTFVQDYSYTLQAAGTGKNPDTFHKPFVLRAADGYIWVLYIKSSYDAVSVGYRRYQVCKCSTNFNPASSTDWSAENEVYGTGTYGLFGDGDPVGDAGITAAPFGSGAAWDVLTSFYYTDNLGVAYLGTYEARWDGTTFQTGTSHVGLHPSLYNDRYSLVIDTSNYGHIIVQAPGVYIWHRKWTIGSGWSAPTIVDFYGWGTGFNSLALSIDLTSSPNRLLAMYCRTLRPDFTGHELIRYKTSPVDTISWSSESTVSDDASGMFYYSSSYRDASYKIQLIYLVSATIRFFEVDLTPPPVAVVGYGDGLVWVG